MNLIRTTSILTFVLPLVACGGGGGKKGGGDPLLPPANLSYGANVAFYLPGVSIPDNSPSVEGTVESYSVAPALPAGISLDPATGIISGSPTDLDSRASYTITATGPLGSTTAGIEFAVVQPPRFAFASSTEDDTLSTYVMDPATGILKLQAVRVAPTGEEDPGELIAHPSGSYIYSVNGVGNISHYRLAVASGRLDSRGTIATGSGPHAVAVAPGGESLYVLARGEDAVYIYDIDPDGALTQLGAPVATDLGAASITISPEGTFAYVAQEDASSVRTFAIDASTGALTQAGADTVFPGQSPVGVSVGPGGIWGFVALTENREIIPVGIDPVSGSLAPALSGATTERAPGIVAVHPTEQFLYAATGDTGEVEVLTFDPITESLVATLEVDLGSQPGEITFDASGLYALISLPDENRLAVFEVDLTTGNLSNELSVPSRRGSEALALTIGSAAVERIPEFLYVAGEDSNVVLAGSAAPENGGLTPLGVSVPAGSRPRSVAFDPLGRFAFAAGAGSRTINTYLMENDGTLTDSGISLLLDDSPRGMGIDPTGRYLYAAARNTATLRSYSIA
ncbi:MAG: beta-propeller fold lactonase family protein, partial [Myxococcota bacterium]